MEHLRAGGRRMTAYDYIVAGTIVLTAILLITLAIWRDG